MLTVKATELQFNSDPLSSSEVSQSYPFSLPQAEHACQQLLLASQVSQRWQQQDNFHIAELGFSTGITFLTTAKLWQQENKGKQLVFSSIEAEPIAIDQLRQLYQQLGLSSVCAEQLLAEYPDRLQGQHRIHFAAANIKLDLYWGDITEVISELEFSADAWILGARHPSQAMLPYSAALSDGLFRLTATAGYLAGITQGDDSLRQQSELNLQAAGFEIEAKISHNSEDQADQQPILIGVKARQKDTPSFTLKDKSWLHAQAHAKHASKTKTALIIGAGLSGFCTAAALKKRGWQVRIVDRNKAPAMAGSGNQNAILMPRLSVDHDAQSQLTLLGFEYSLRFLNHLKAQFPELKWDACGVIQVARDAKQWQRMQRLYEQEAIPESLLCRVSKEQASDYSHCAITEPAWWIAKAGWTIPAQICSLLQQQYDIEFIANTEIVSLQYNDDTENKQWLAKPSGNQAALSADVVILANAEHANQFVQTEWCPLSPKRGQISLIPSQSFSQHPQCILCSDVYLTPEIDNSYVLGASFISDDTATDIRASEHADNFIKLEKMLGTLADKDKSNLGGRAAIRAVSPDRLPIVGAVADSARFRQLYERAALGDTRQDYAAAQYYDGLYLNTAFGSRGLAWIPLCSEALASEISAQPNPLNRSLRQAVHPSRFLMRALQQLLNK